VSRNSKRTISLWIWVLGFVLVVFVLAFLAMCTLAPSAT
jgi:hypothetical protein